MRALSRPMLQAIKSRLIDRDRPTRFPLSDMVAAIDRVLQVPRGVKLARKAKAERRRESVAETREVRELVVARADGKCEACGAAVEEDASPWRRPEMDHFEGGADRKPLESVETCWLVCWTCHKKKGANEPSPEYWLTAFLAHCLKHGYSTELVDARLASLELEKQLPHGRGRATNGGNNA